MEHLFGCMLDACKLMKLIGLWYRSHRSPACLSLPASERVVWNVAIDKCAECKLRWILCANGPAQGTGRSLYKASDACYAILYVLLSMLMSATHACLSFVRLRYL